MALLISSTLIVAAITGFVFYSERTFFCGVAGQVLHGSLSLLCFTLVGIAFWRFGWTVGLVDLALLFVASNTVLTFYRYLKERSGL
jgi:hypothetical protein